MSRTWIALACAAAALAPPARAGELPGALAAVPGDSAAFISVDVRGVSDSPLCDEVRHALAAIKPAELAAFARKFPVDPMTVERLVFVFPNAATIAEPFPDYHPTAMSPLLVIGCSKPFDPAEAARKFYPAGRPKSYRGKVYQFDEDNWCGLLLMPDNRTLVSGSEDALVWFIDRLEKGGDAGTLAPARAEAAGHTLFLAINPAAAVAPERKLPLALHALTDARRITVAIDLGKNTNGTVEFHYADADAAVKGENAVKAAIGFGRDQLKGLEAELQRVIDKPALTGRGGAIDEFPERFASLVALGAVRRIDEAVAKTPVERKGSAVRLAAELPLPQNSAGVGLFMVAAVTTLGANANHTFEFVGDTIRPPGGEPFGSEEGRLKKLAAAFDAYHAEHGHYPPAFTAAKDGTPVLSWRVALLPYLGEKKLYDEFRQDEPWDSLHNKKLLARMPPVFTKPHRWPKNHGRTTTQVVTGPGTLFDGPKGVKKPQGGAAVLVLEPAGGERVWWTKPADLVAAPGKPPAIFPNDFSGCWAAFSDGTARRLTKKDDEAKLMELVMPR